MSYSIHLTCLKCSLGLIFLLLFHVSKGQYNLSEIDEVIGDKKASALGNASVIVWKDSAIVYKKDTGAMKLGKLEAQQPLGAMSRWLTVALVMTFVEEGKISLDDYVSNYIPIFSSYSKGYITIRQCLNNTTGIEPSPTVIQRKVQSRKFESLEEKVNFYAAHLDIINNPGKDFAYGDVGITILGRVLEIVSKKKTFDRLIMEKIIRPVGMKKTTFMVESGAVNPSAGALSTASDYIKFLAMLSNKGVVNGKQIISEASVDEIHKVQITTELDKYTAKLMEGSLFGYGVFLKDAATVICCPSFTGSWAFIDKNRNYSCIILTPPIKGDPKADMYNRIKAILDAQFSSL